MAFKLAVLGPAAVGTSPQIAKRPLALGLTGDFLPVDALQPGVFLKHLFVLNQHAAHHTRIVRSAQLQNAVRDDAHFFVCVQQRKHRLGDGLIRQFLVSAFNRVLGGIGQKFQLVHQMRKLRRVDLGEFELPLRQLPQNLFGNRRGDRAGGAVHKLGNFRHGGRESMKISAPVKVKSG